MVYHGNHIGSKYAEAFVMDMGTVSSFKKFKYLTPPQHFHECMKRANTGFIKAIGIGIIETPCSSSPLL
jgi:hypothetical protein